MRDFRCADSIAVGCKRFELIQVLGWQQRLTANRLLPE